MDKGKTKLTPTRRGTSTAKLSPAAKSRSRQSNRVVSRGAASAAADDTSEDLIDEIAGHESGEDDEDTLLAKMAEECSSEGEAQRPESRELDFDDVGATLQQPIIQAPAPPATATGVTPTVLGGIVDTNSESFGYDGGQIAPLVGPSFALAVANGVKVFDQEGKTESHLWGIGRAVGAVASSRSGDLLAYSDKGIRPSVRVLKFPGFGQVSVLQGGTTLEFGSMCFSGDGTLLATLGSLPDFRLSVWKVDEPRQEPLLVSVEGSAAPCTQVSFDPTSSSLLCTSGGGRIVFWVIENRGGKFFVVRSDVSSIAGADDTRPLTTESVAAWHERELQEAVPGETPFTRHCWIPRHRLLCGDANGSVHLYSPLSRDPPAVWKVPGVPAITSILATKTGLIVGGSDGSVSWVDAETHVALTRVQVSPGPVTALAARKVLLAGSLDGKLVSLPVTPSREKLATAPKAIGDSHSSPVTGLATLSGLPVLFSCSLDGNLRAWDYAGGATVATFSVDLGASLAALCSSPLSNTIAVGSAKGVVRAFAVVANPKQPVMFYRGRVHRGPILRMAYHPHQLFLAVACEGGRLYLLDTVTPQYRPIGFIDLGADITDLAWNIANVESQLFVALAGGSVYRLAVPEKRSSKELCLSFRDLSTNAMKIHWTPTALAVDPHGTSVSKQFFFVLTEDCGLRRFMMPDRALEPELLDEGDVTQPKDEVKCHEKPGRCLSLSPDGTALVSGGGDGVLLVRNAESFKTVLRELRGNDPTGGISALCFSPDSKFVFSASCKAIVRWQLHERGAKPSGGPEEFVPYRSFQVQSVKNTPDSADEPAACDGVPQVDHRHQQQQQQGQDAARAEVKQKLQQVVVTLSGLIEQNEHATEGGEKLTDDELLVNLEERDRLRQEGARQVAALKERIHEENLAREMITERLKAEFWDSMEDHAVVVAGFKKKVEVANFPLRKRTPQELRAQNQIILLRRTELLEFRRRQHAFAAAFPDMAKAISTPTVGYFAGSMRMLQAEVDARKRRQGVGALVATTSAAAGAPTAAPDAAKAAPAELEEPDDTATLIPGEKCREKDLRALLYHPFDLHTPMRKRTQMHLLRWIIRDIQKQFNEDVARYLELKKAALSKVEERNARIREIAAELREKVDVWTPVLADAERPESVFEVREDEVVSKKQLGTGETPSARAAKKGPGGVDAGEEESALRGLKAMMGGRLDRVGAQGALGAEDEEADQQGKPGWYGTRDPETEDEKKAAKEYEKQVQVRREERQKHRKALETELKKLASLNEETCVGFDEKLVLFQQQRMKTDHLVCQEQLRVVRLAAALMVQEDDSRKEVALAETLEKLKKRKAKASTALAEARSKHDATRTEHEARLQNDRIIEKSFRRDFERAEREDIFPALLRVFRFRKKPQQQQQPEQKTTAAARPGQVADDEGDPFTGVEEAVEEVGQLPQQPTEECAAEGGGPFQLPKDAESIAAEEESLAVAPEKPAEIDDVTWERLLEIRSEKIKSEIGVRRAAADFEEAKTALALAQRRNDRARRQLEEAGATIAVFKRQQQWNSMNLELMLKLKQGQLEVEEAPVVTRLDSAVMIESTRVEELNTQIRSLAKEKAGQLEEMKDAKKVIAKKKWENTGIDMQIQDLQDKTKFLQLMRVTKQLQEFLKGGGEEQQSQELASLEHRVEHEKKSYETKLEELRKKLAKVQQDTALKVKENERLTGEMASLKSSVSERGKIHQVQQAAAAQGSQGATRLERFYQREKLEAQVKAQAQEIKLLKTALASTQRSTFPTL